VDINNNNNTAVAEMPAELAALLAEFLTRLEDKNLNEIMPILAEFKARLPKDKTFSDEEKSAVIEGALGQMPIEERGRYKALLKMFGIA